MAVRCGLDLGTTYSSIAWYDEHRTKRIGDLLDGCHELRPETAWLDADSVLRMSSRGKR
jgi:molecular chaperone DnaK (HSP70)